MAGNTRKLTVEIIGDAKGMTRATAEADNAVDAFGKKLGGFADIVKGAFVATAVVDFARESVKAAQEDAAAQDRLAKTLQNVVGATDEQIAAVEASIGSMEDQYAVADDKLRPAFETLVRETKDVSQAQADMQTALDISAGTGKDLEAVALALVKAHNGQYRALRDLGVEVKDAEGKTRSYADVQAELNQMFAGAAANAVDTQEGRMRKLALQYDNLKEEIGTALLPIMGQLVDMASTLLGWWSSLDGGTQKLIVQIVGLGAAVYGAHKIVSGFITLAGGMKSAVGGLITALTSMNPVMLGVVGGAGVLTAAYLMMRNEKSLLTEQTEKYVAALNDEATGQADASFKAVAEQLATLTPNAKNFGLSLADLVEITKTGVIPSITELTERYKANTGETTVAIPIVTGLRQALVLEADAFKAATAKVREQEAAQKLVNDAVQEGTAVTNEVTVATHAHGDAADNTARKVQIENREIRDLESALTALWNATQSMIDANFAYESATNQVEDAVNAANLAIYTTGTTSESTERAMLSLEQAIDGQADAAVRLASDQAALEGRTLSTAEAQRIYRAEVDKAARGSTAAAQAAGYLREQLDSIPRNINVHIELKVTGQKVTKDGDVIGVSTPTPRAFGGPVGPGRMYVVGEHGPEIVQFGSTGTVTPNHRLGEVLGSGSASGDVPQVHLHYYGVTADSDLAARSSREMAWRLRML